MHLHPQIQIPNAFPECTLDNCKYAGYNIRHSKDWSALLYQKTKLKTKIAVSELKKTLLSGEDCLNVQKAAKGDEVTVHYEGRLQSNGFKFDSSFDRGEPIKFTLGTNQVVQGWERGLVGT